MKVLLITIAMLCLLPTSGLGELSIGSRKLITLDEGTVFGAAIEKGGERIAVQTIVRIGTRQNGSAVRIRRLTLLNAVNGNVEQTLSLGELPEHLDTLPCGTMKFLSLSNTLAICSAQDSIELIQVSSLTLVSKIPETDSGRIFDFGVDEAQNRLLIAEFNLEGEMLVSDMVLTTGKSIATSRFPGDFDKVPLTVYSEKHMLYFLVRDNLRPSKQAVKLEACLYINELACDQHDTSAAWKYLDVSADGIVAIEKNNNSPTAKCISIIKEDSTISGKQFCSSYRAASLDAIATADSGTMVAAVIGKDNYSYWGGRNGSFNGVIAVWPARLAEPLLVPIDVDFGVIASQMRLVGASDRRIVVLFGLFSNKLLVLSFV